MGNRVTGFWVGLTVSFLLASLAMVQIRSKLFGGLPSGGWPNDEYTWHFLPPFIFILVLWYMAGRVWSKKRGFPTKDGVSALGAAASPMLGLVVAWSWYGLMSPQFHPSGGYDIPVLCHDTIPFNIVVWSAPWIVLG